MQLLTDIAKRFEIVQTQIDWVILAATADVQHPCHQRAPLPQHLLQRTQHRLLPSRRFSRHGPPARSHERTPQSKKVKSTQQQPCKIAETVYLVSIMSSASGCENSDVPARRMGEVNARGRWAAHQMCILHDAALQKNENSDNDISRSWEATPSRTRRSHADTVCLSPFPLDYPLHRLGRVLGFALCHLGADDGRRSIGPQSH